MRTLEVAEFATEMHEGQVRKYTGEPYIEHPIAVALLVERFLEARGGRGHRIRYQCSSFA